MGLLLSFLLLFFLQRGRAFYVDEATQELNGSLLEMEDLNRSSFTTADVKNNRSIVLFGRGFAVTSSNTFATHINRNINFVNQSSEMADFFALGLWEILRRNKCHTILVALNILKPELISVIRYSKRYFYPLLLVDLTTLHKGDNEQLLKSFWGSSFTTCRAVVVDIISESNEATFGFLETFKLWQWADARVILLGKTPRASSLLQHSVLRNNINALYYHMLETGATDLESPENTSLSRAVAYVYSRCLYCNNGKSQVRLLSTWQRDLVMSQLTNIFSDLTTNFGGELVRVGNFPSYFPYNDYIRPPNGSLTQKLELSDCLDKRLLDTLSLHSNVSFEFISPLDFTPGYLTDNGSWTGVMKLIAEGEAEVTMSIIMNPERIAIIDFKTTCEIDRVGIVSLAPQVMPRYLVITRPFTADVWIYILISIVIWSISLWILQRIWTSFSGRKTLSLNEALFYGWAVMLEDAPSSPPKNYTGRIMVGWWLVVSLLLTTGFRSALVAHLLVESKTKPIDSFEDLVQQHNWGWGFETQLLLGGPGFYFKYSPDPLVQRIYRDLEGIDSDVGLEKVKRGGYSLLGTQNRIYTLIAVYKSDKNRRHPFYFSKTTYRIASDIGLGFRKGVPFKRRFFQLINRLTEAGIIDLWIQDVVEKRIKESRSENASQEEEGVDIIKAKEEDKRIVLRMTHLIGVFLLYLIGNGISLMTLILEQISKRVENKANLDVSNQENYYDAET